ncbi:MAG: hypothetical protein GY906_10270 [bacterium]|nr:hypothetical protein [bacterium]
MSSLDIYKATPGFWACRSCWLDHSGVGPTYRHNKSWRPVQRRDRHGTCEFCEQEITGEMWGYVEVDMGQ